MDVFVVTNQNEPIWGSSKKGLRDHPHAKEANSNDGDNHSNLFQHLHESRGLYVLSVRSRLGHSRYYNARDGIIYNHVLIDE